MNNEEKGKTLTPPYLSVSKIEETLRLLSNRNFKSVSPTDFEGYKFGKADALLAVNMLRFLRLIDETGTPTAHMASVRLVGDRRKAELEKILRGAYAALFERVDKPQDLSKDDLMNELTSVYDLSNRVVGAAVPAFIKLCEFAGLKEEGSIIGRKRASKSNKPLENKNSSLAKSGEEIEALSNKAGFFPVRVAEGRLILSMPQTLRDRLLDDDALSDDWKILRNALRSFAEKYLPESEDKLIEE